MRRVQEELDGRRARFCEAMTAAFPDWDTAVIFGKVNQYYFTGTMQDAVLIIKNDGRYALFVRRSFTRAMAESPLPHIFSMNSYRDAAQAIDSDLGSTYIDCDTATYSMVERFRGYFKMSSVGSLENVLRGVRAVKSPYELYWMEESGKQHHELLTKDVPGMLKEGMSESELVAEVQKSMILRGHQGVARFAMFQAEVVTGQFGFGENSVYPSSFNGPGGGKGYGPAAPVGGDSGRRLEKGDLVFIDIGFAMCGYHSDKTQVYMFGDRPSEQVLAIQRACIEVQRRAASMLVPGAVPSEIYKECVGNPPQELKDGFMGFKGHYVKFLGHGVGLHIDELPVIAPGFDEPLVENMVISIEPKKGLEGVGMLGVEDTYVVTPGGGRCITGGGRDIIVVQ